MASGVHGLDASVLGNFSGAELVGLAHPRRLKLATSFGLKEAFPTRPGWQGLWWCYWLPLLGGASAASQEPLIGGIVLSPSVFQWHIVVSIL